MRLWHVLLVAALSGFVALSYEILWFRAYSFASGGSPVAFGVLLGAYLLGIAIGSRESRRLCRDREDPGAGVGAMSWLLVAAALLGYLAAPFASWTAIALHWTASLPFVALAAGAMGVVLPLLAHAGIAPDERAGARLSYLYLANIVGSASGSLVTGFVLMDAMTYPAIARALFGVGLLIAVSVVVVPAARAHRTRVLAAAALVAVAGFGFGPVVHDGLYERLLFKRDYVAGTRFAHTLENRHGVITIGEDLTVYGGGVFDGRVEVDLVHDRNWIARPFLLPAFGRTPREVLMVGLSMGPWAQVVVNLPGVERLTIIEINPGYLDLIQLYPAVASLLANPKIEIVVDDGRRWITRHPNRRFDLIVQNTTWHWRSNATNLLSREYLALCRERLAPGGLMLFNTTFSEDAMLTALDVFPHGVRIFNNMLVSDRPLDFDAAALRSALASVAIDGTPVFDLADPEQRGRLDYLCALGDTIGDPPIKEGLEAGVDLRPRLEANGAGVITDDNMLCEWRHLHW